MLRKLGFRVHLRYLRYLLYEFRYSLGTFASTVLLGGLILHFLYQKEPVGFSKAFYNVFMMVFLETSLDFPDEWYLQPLFFLVPMIGLAAVADSLVRLAFLVFTQKRNLPEWQRMVASLYRGHVVVVGIGRVGFRVVSDLVALKENVVAIDMGASHLIDQVLDLGVPVISGNARLEKVLVDAGVANASAVILVTSDDLTNIDAGLTARDLNSKARIVLRLFDESLALKITGAFAMPAISTASVSSPAFIAAATNRRVYQPFELAGQKVHMTELVINAEARLVGRTVGAIQHDTVVNVVMHRTGDQVDVNPSHQVVLKAGDSVLVIATLDRMLALEADNHPSGKVSKEAVQLMTTTGQTSFPDLIG